MKDFKLTLYDWLGYLIPGTILTVAFYVNYKDSLVFTDIIKIEPSFASGFVFFCITYLAGHLIHAIANFTIDLLPYGKYAPPHYFKNKLSEDFNVSQRNRIKKILQTKFDIEIEGDDDNVLKQNYWICYNHVSQTISNPLCKTFLYLNGFCRGISVSLFLSSVIFFISPLDVNPISHPLLLNSILILSSLLLYFRAVRFKIYLTRSVYMEFLSAHTNK